MLLEPDICASEGTTANFGNAVATSADDVLYTVRIKKGDTEHYLSNDNYRLHLSNTSYFFDTEELLLALNEVLMDFTPIVNFSELRIIRF